MALSFLLEKVGGQSHSRHQEPEQQHEVEHNWGAGGTKHPLLCHTAPQQRELKNVVILLLNVSAILFILLSSHTLNTEGQNPMWSTNPLDVVSCGECDSSYERQQRAIVNPHPGHRLHIHQVQHIEGDQELLFPRQTGHERCGEFLLH